MMQLSITVEDRELRRLLQRMVRNGHNLRPALAEVGEIVIASVERNFAEGGRPHKWPVSRRVKREGGQTLSDTGRLRRSITKRVGRDEVAVGTNVEYAAALHFGAKIGPHVIRPKKAGALFWPGAKHPVKQVRHPGATIPARPFLMVQRQDWPHIKRALIRHYTRR